MPEESESQPDFKRTEKPNFLTKTSFNQFDIPAEVLKGLKDAEFSNCTPIQAQVLPVALSGHDIAGQAQTGTGKTAAFLVPLFAKLFGMPRSGLPLALIIAPTRELAIQIYNDASIIGRYTDLKIGQVIGGIDYNKQARMLKEGLDIVICTPGRIIDYFKQGIFKTKNIKSLVIDEADRLFDLGFTKDMRYILRKLPKYEKRQSMLFSATLSYRVMELTYEFMNLPEFISVTPEEVAVDAIEQTLFHVGKFEKMKLLLGLLKREEWNRILIFSNTKSGVEFITAKLIGNGFPAQGITGDLPQRKRLRLMERYKKGEIKILVATDVASRGIHVEDISHVINYDIPQDVENYVHRIGRTARAGKKGRALSMACEDYVYHLEPLENLIGYKIPVVWPEEDWFEEDKSKYRPRKRRAWPKKGRPKNNNFKKHSRKGPPRSGSKGPGQRRHRKPSSSS